MRATLVVPSCETTELTSELPWPQRNNDSANTLLLDGENEPLDDGDTPLLADGAVSWGLDAFALQPAPKRIAVKDAISVADDVLGCRARTTEHLPQEGTHTAAIWPLGQNAQAGDAAREVIHDHHYPPTEGPPLWQGKRQPRRPKPAADGHRR